MKEIKFRQAIFKDGRFHHWHYWGFCGYRREFVAPIISNLSESGYEIKPSEQFTGPEDDNSRKIYEGDIIRQVHIIDLGHKKVDETHLWIVKFGVTILGTGFYLKFTGSDAIKELNPKEFKDYKIVEVIGNIHENPELIE